MCTHTDAKDTDMFKKHWSTWSNNNFLLLFKKHCEDHANLHKAKNVRSDYPCDDI